MEKFQITAPTISAQQQKNGTRKINIAVLPTPQVPIDLEERRIEKQQANPEISEQEMNQVAAHFAQCFTGTRAIENIIKKYLDPEYKGIEQDKEILKLYADQHEAELFPNSKVKTALLPYNVTINRRRGKENYNLSLMPLPYRIYLITKYPEAFSLALIDDIKNDEEAMKALDNCPTTTAAPTYSVTLAPNARG